MDPNVRFNPSRWARRGLDELLGLVRGIVADGVVTDAEMVALTRWMAANPLVAGVWPGDVLADRLGRIFADGVVDAEERAELTLLLHQAAGETPGELATMAAATRLPLDAPPPGLAYPGQVYVFTGAFVYGTRKACERAVADRGGRCGSSITRDTRVLVIGALASEAWVHSTHGRKIEKAVQYREAGVPLAIVDEEHWARSLH